VNSRPCEENFQDLLNTRILLHSSTSERRNLISFTIRLRVIFHRTMSCEGTRNDSREIVNRVAGRERIFVFHAKTKLARTPFQLMRRDKSLND